MSSSAEMKAAEKEGPGLQGAAAEGPGVSGPRLTSTKPASALLEEAAQMKMEGNAFYRDKKVRSAIGRYHRALLILRGLDSDVMTRVKDFGPKTPALTPEEEALLRNTQVDCYNNLAACLLQREPVDFARVQEYSLRVLHWRPGNVKALYRAGVASLEMGDAEMAKLYLIRAGTEQPNDVNVRKQLLRAEEKLNWDRQKEKALYRGMFSSGLKSSSADGISPTSRARDGV